MTPTPGQPLSEADVSLLQPRDWLPGDWLLPNSKQVDAQLPSHPVRAVRTDETRVQVGTGVWFLKSRFTFLGRPDQDGWIFNPEGWAENPVPGVTIEYRCRSGSTWALPVSLPSEALRWGNSGWSGDIIAYRPHAPVSRPGDGVEGGWDRDLERGASAFIATSFGFSGPNDQDTPLQAAAREVGWMLSEVVDRIEWNKRGQAASALGRLATSIDGLVWPWEGDDPRHDQIRHSWRSFADNSADDDGRIDLTDVETCVAIGVMKAFQLLSPALTPPAEPVSRPAGEGETTQHTPRCWGRTSYSDEMAHCYCKPAGEGEREAVARLIDDAPQSWSSDELADRILALLRPAAPDAGGGGEEDIMRTQEDWSALLYGRDSFIVRKGLWSEFVDSLPALQPGGER